MHNEIVEEIHAHRAELYKRFHGDAEAIFRYYKDLEMRNTGRRSADKILPRRASALK